MKLRIIATTVITAALLTTGTVAASASTTDTAPPATSECQFGEHLLHAWLRLPADLRSDLKALKDLEPGERADAAREIRGDALKGEYGERVQLGAEKLRDRRIVAIQNMPVELKTDLIELREADPSERRDLAKEIADTALDGRYGEKAQAVAERIQASDAWQDCVAD